MFRTTLVFFLSFSAVALAGTRETAVSEALDLVKDAKEEAADATGECRRALKGLGSLVDKLEALDRAPSDKALSRAKEQAEDLSDAAKDDCRGDVARRVRKSLDKAVAQLERALDTKDSKRTATAPRAQEQQPPPQGANVLVQLAGGLGGLFGNAQSTTTVNRSETSTSRRTEEVNGRSVDDDEDDAPARRPAKQQPTRAGFQATCRTNADCESNTCFVGSGELGYCTKMCNSWSECPSFWECKRAGNAPQNICQQK